MQNALVSWREAVTLTGCLDVVHNSVPRTIKIRVGEILLCVKSYFFHTGMEYSGRVQYQAQRKLKIVHEYNIISLLSFSATLTALFCFIALPSACSGRQHFRSI
jgi:hypothetical protein